VYQGRLVWLDAIKAVALIWIFLNHLAERLFGYPYIANPYYGWPSLSERIAQLIPLQGEGFWDLPINLFRYVGWAGDQGVQLFIVLSGFGLTWGVLQRSALSPFSPWRFFRRRVARVYPLWWSVHIFFIMSWLFTGWGLSLVNPATYFSFLGIRFTPDLFYYFAPAWWYIGLLLQFYLLFPMLFQLLRRLKPARFLFISVVITIAARALGFLFFEGYLDVWQRGAIFLTRWVEFSFGMCAAVWLWKEPARFHSLMRKPMMLLSALFMYVLGTVFSLTLMGMTVAPFLQGSTLFIMLYATFTGPGEPTGRRHGILDWLGRRTFSIYLIHHPVILLLIPDQTVLEPSLIVRFLAAFIVTVIGAQILEKITNSIQSIGVDWYRKLGLKRFTARVVGSALVIVLVLLGAEATIRWRVPQEVLGWGERPSLEPHLDFGWRLIPLKESRLRWESYDYLVSSNKLGFPGPDYSPEKTENVFRILTIGDAFTSAEGVDTGSAWPRLLETELRKQLPGRDVQVLNFAVTGYGPNQYDAVLRKFIPLFEPDWIVIGVFVNDLQDVQWTNDDFRNSIGFHLPEQNGVFSFLSLQHLRRYMRSNIADPFVALVRRQPDQHGYFLGNFSFLERSNLETLREGQQLVTERLRAIKAVADQVGARVDIFIIPASVQVCAPNELDYYPRYIDLSDRDRFDLEQPQGLIRESAAQVGIPAHNLLEVMHNNVSGCFYQQRNMHWTEDGHLFMARYLAEQAQEQLVAK
jgi:peptidoglycan/LPS O-acetylase OafA/YrhL